MISDDDVDRALQWLVSNADKAAQARAERVYVEEFRKVIKARLMDEALRKGFSSLGAQETYAYANGEYIEHLDAIKEAVEADERFRWLQVTAQARLEAWRSMQANQRAQAKIG